MDYEKTIRGFREYLGRKYRLCPQTIERYRNDWKAFFSFLAASGVKELREAGPALIREYRAKVMSQTLGDTVKGDRIRIVKRLFEYLTESNRLLINPAEGLERVPRNRERPKTPLTDKEIIRLMRQPDLGSPLGFRDYLILELLITAGLTRNEFLGLKVFDVDLNRGRLYARNNRTKRTRAVPLGENAVKLLSRYLEETRPSRAAFNPQERALFLSMKGKRLERQGLYLLLKKYKHMAGIKKPVTCIGLRHGYALRRLKEKNNIEDVGKLLGHKHTASTRVAYILRKE